MEKQEIYEIMDFMKIVYQGRKIDTSNEAIETWSIMFEDYTKHEVQQAIKKLVKTSKYVPSIHEILENIEDTFTVDRIMMTNGVALLVRFRDEIIPFRFNEQSKAMTLVEHLRSYPTREDILLLHEKNMREVNPFTRSVYVDQSGREEFDKRMKNEYYVQKMKG